MKLDTDLIKKIEQLSKLKLEDKDIEFEHKFNNVEKIKELVLEKIYSKIPKHKVIETLSHNGFDDKEANQIITFTLSTIFKNSSYWYRDDVDSLETFIEEINSEIESSKNEELEYKYKPLSFRVDIELRPNWFNIIQKIAEKNNLTALEYFRDFLTDSGFDETHLKDREENPKMLKVKDLDEEKLKEWLNWGSFDGFADNFKKGFLGKSFNFAYFSDTITGKKIPFGNMISNSYNNDKKLLSSDMDFRGQIISKNVAEEKSLPEIDSLEHPMSFAGSMSTKGHRSESKYYKYFPLFNLVEINPFRMSFSEPDELGIDSVYFFFGAKDESLKKLQWERDERFPMFTLLNKIVEFFLSKGVFHGFSDEEEKIKNEFPILIQNLLKKNNIKYVGKTGTAGLDLYPKWHTFENEYCNTRINVETFSPEIALHPIEYFKFDVDNGLHGIHNYLKELGYLK